MSKQTSSQPKQRPSRPLTADFSDRIMRQAMTAKRRAGHRLRAPFNLRSTYMKSTHKPLFATLAVIAVVGLSGTTYAAFNGGLSSITALFGGEHKIHNARIVKVAVQNCHDLNPFNAVSGTGNGNTDRYYVVKDAATISNDQVVSLAQSICRSVYNQPAELALVNSVQNRPENKDKLIGNGEGKIVSITPTTIAIEVDGAVTSDHKPYIEHFTTIDASAVVFDGSGKARSLSILKVGDVVYSQFRSQPDSTYNTESTTLNNVDWSQQILVTVTKRNTDQAAYDKYQKLTQTKLLEQVVPCKNNTIGYCTYDQLNR